MGRMQLLILAVLAALLVSPFAMAEGDAYGEADGLLLYEVNPKTAYEGVSVYNYGTKSIDMADYGITDREGSITFTESLIVGAGERATFCKKSSPDDYFSSRDNVYLDGTNGVSFGKNYALNDLGDDIYLTKNGVDVDAVCYGNFTISDDTLWFGPSVSVSSGFVFRMLDFDHDTSEDWFKFKEGLTNFYFDADLKYDATVTAFTFPESGGIPVYRALESATTSVDIEIYMITSKNVYGLLVDLAERGVEVRLLVEGAAVGSDLATYAPHIRALVDAGGEAHAIGMGNSADRYSNVHAKYAVIDKRTVVITSENWTTENMNGKITKDPYASSSKGNRGWGAVVESAGYAEFMTKVFENDYDTKYGDTKDFMELYPRSVASTLTYTSPTEDPECPKERTKVTPILSNDSSYQGIKYYIGESDKRIYAQNQSLSSYYLNLGDLSPVTLISKRAGNGVESKVMLGTNATDVDNQIYLINSNTMIKAAKMVTPYLHNKGMVLDDVAIVSSINWTPTSVMENRETAVAIHSAKIADYFADIFLKDFERYYDYEGFKVDTSKIQTSYPSGKEITMQVDVSPAGSYTYLWDLGDGSEPITTTSKKITARPADGAHVLKVTVTNEKGVSQIITRDYAVVDEAEDDGVLPEIASGPWIYLAPILAAIAGLAAVLRRHR